MFYGYVGGFFQYSIFEGEFVKILELGESWEPSRNPGSSILSILDFYSQKQGWHMYGCSQKG